MTETKETKKREPSLVHIAKLGKYDIYCDKMSYNLTEGSYTIYPGTIEQCFKVIIEREEKKALQNKSKTTGVMTTAQEILECIKEFQDNEAVKYGVELIRACKEFNSSTEQVFKDIDEPRKKV